MDTEKLRRYANLVKSSKVFRALVNAIPFGGSLDVLIYDGEVEKLITSLSQESETRQNEILAKLDKIYAKYVADENFIVTIGSGNAENVLSLYDSVKLGQKHSVELKELYGGSGVNHAFRLTTMGYNVFPILSIGHDGTAKRIQKELCKIANSNETSPVVIEYIESDKFFEPKIVTSTSTVIVEGSKRTIFSQKLDCLDHFCQHVGNRLEFIEDLIVNFPKAIIIGHVHSDSGDCNPGIKGETTKYVINKYKEKSLIYTNFGNSQIKLGLDEWEAELPHIDVFQLNISEAKRLFSKDGGSSIRLIDIVEKIRDLKMTAVITIDRFGAIGIHKDPSKGIIFAWPLIDVKDIVDTTGAGDAFAAGMVSKLVGKKGFNIYEFLEAMEVGRNWSAYACTTLGGSGECPAKSQLDGFVEKQSSNKNGEIEIVKKEDSTKYLSLIDMAYQ